MHLVAWDKVCTPMGKGGGGKAEEVTAFESNVAI